jgi:alkanesulfonate monooxygenase SsuD/methylene tetrahydromethanopterin reductase-like flavin-dependent oxidoreductase (luciferase family)
MRLGFAFSNYTWSADQGLLEDTFRLIVERAERAGFFSLWLPDYFFQVGAPAGSTENEMLEGRGRRGGFRSCYFYYAQQH